MKSARFAGRPPRGVSLIELMIALVIASLLILGLVEVFSASRTAYQLSEGLARVQENGRFAVDYIQRDFRLAGHMGCVNDQARFLPENTSGTRSALASTFLEDTDQLAKNYEAGYVPHYLRFDFPIQAYEANDTGPADELDLPADPVESGTATNWSPALPGDLNADLDNKVDGSDILVLRQFSGLGAQVVSFTPNDPTATIVVDTTQWDRMVENLPNPGLFGIADCLSAGVFHATAIDAASGTITVTTDPSINRSAMAGYESYVPGQASVYVAETLVYYVGLNEADNPSLYRLRYSIPPGSAAVSKDKEELVEGIESLQLRFGQDSRVAVGERPTGNMGSSATADSLTQPDTLADAWRRVGLVQVGLVARSANPAAASQREDDATKLSAVGVTMVPPEDGRYRAVYESTVALRNRLFGH